MVVSWKKTLRTWCALSAVVAGMALGAASAQANLVTNGSFEDPTTGSYTHIGVGSPALTGWTVSGAPGTGVDVVTQSLLGAAYDGAQYVDLAGSPGPGTISQTLATVVGQLYQLTFAYSSNWQGGLSTKQATVSVLDGFTSLYSDTLSHSGSSLSNLDWQVVTTTFTATSASTTLQFDSISGGSWGILVDAVSVDAVTSPVPEPGSLALAGIAGIGAFFARRRKAAVA